MSSTQVPSSPLTQPAGKKNPRGGTFQYFIRGQYDKANEEDDFRVERIRKQKLAPYDKMVGARTRVVVKRRGGGGGGGGRRDVMSWLLVLVGCDGDVTCSYKQLKSFHYGAALDAALRTTNPLVSAGSVLVLVLFFLFFLFVWVFMFLYFFVFVVVVVDEDEDDDDGDDNDAAA